jgi:hypothetical protein
MAEDFSVLSEIGSIKIDDENEIRFSADSFKGHKYASVRKYLKNGTYDGPTKAGITLSPEMTVKIAAAIAALPDDPNSAQDAELGKYAKKQGLSVICAVNSYMGLKGLDLRQWQEDDRYKGWTKKGIRLPLSQIKEIKELFAKLAQYFSKEV